MINTKKVKGRRRLRFEDFAAVHCKMPIAWPTPSAAARSARPAIGRSVKAWGTSAFGPGRPSTAIRRCRGRRSYCE